MSVFNYLPVYGIVLLFMQTYASSNTVAINETKCRGADIVFLLDTSRSVWLPDFQRQLNFTTDVVDQFNVGPGNSQTRVGVLTFGRSSYLQFYLRSYKDKGYLKRAIRRIRHRYSGGTNIAAAINFMKKYMFKPFVGGRPNSTHVAIVITDGISQNPKSTREKALLAKKDGIQIFAIGVGNRVAEQELENIASKPKEKYVLRVNDFNTLNSIKTSLPSTVCEVTTTTTTSTTTTTATTTTTTTTASTTATTPVPQTTTRTVAVPLKGNDIHVQTSISHGNRPQNDIAISDDPRQYCGGKDADVYFALDSSSSIWPEDFKKQQQFVIDLVDTFDFNNNKTRVGVLVYSSQIYPRVPLDSRWTKEQIKRQISSFNYTSGLTNTSDAIRFIRKYGFTEQNSRPNAIKIGIILTDGISRDPLATKQESEKCRTDGITLFAIGVGRDIDKTELKRIANDPDDKFVFHVNGFAALPSIRSKVAVSACGVVPDQPSNLLSCGQDTIADVMFVYDAPALGARKSELITSFVYDVSRHLQTFPNQLRIGRKTYNCPINSDVPLTSTTNRLQFSSLQFPGIETLVGHLRRSFPGRLDAKNLAVLFVDESTQNIEQASRVLKADKNFHVMVVAIGDMSMVRVASDLASLPFSDYLVHIPTYMTMANSQYEFLQKLCYLITNEAIYLKDQRVP